MGVTVGTYRAARKWFSMNKRDAMWTATLITLTGAVLVQVAKDRSDQGFNRNELYAGSTGVPLGLAFPFFLKEF